MTSLKEQLKLELAVLYGLEAAENGASPTPLACHQTKALMKPDAKIGENLPLMKAFATGYQRFLTKITVVDTEATLPDQLMG